MKQISWFGAQRLPFTSYVNHLFVYPQLVEVKHHHPNVRVKIELKADDTLDSKSLKNIYSRWAGDAFVTEDFTSICPKERQFVFSYSPLIF